MIARRKPWSARTIVLSLVALLGVCGCGTLSAPFTDGYAEVRIAGHTREEIHDTLVSVFESDGYSVVIPSQDRPVFEKVAPVNYQGAYRSIGGKPVDVRVKVTISRLKADTYRIACTPHIVRDNGDPYVEEEVPLSNMRIRPYQKLLDQVAAELNPPKK
ncbi:MAG: hypothetical protein U1F98_05770 [Verrucomicrobiota bacterium]